MNAGVAPSQSGHVIMHFTHIENLPNIVAGGCLQADSGVRRGSQLLVEAADLEIKARRRTVLAPLAPYGCVADYVPFYFAPRPPMLYKLWKGGVAGYADGQDPLVYLVSSAETVADAGLRYLFSDGNCAAAVTQMACDLALLSSMVDWEVMRAQMWSNTAEDPDRMRRRMAEFLVHDRLSLDCVTGVVVRTERMKAQAEAVLAADSVVHPVHVRPGWYFWNVGPRVYAWTRG